MLRTLWSQQKVQQHLTVKWYLWNKNHKSVEFIKNWDLPQGVSQLRREETAHKLGWAPSKPFSCQIWKHLHTILKRNLEFLIQGFFRLSYSILPAINLQLAGEVCRRLEVLALREATFQFFLFNCEWHPAYVSFATAWNTVSTWRGVCEGKRRHDRGNGQKSEDRRATNWQKSCDSQVRSFEATYYDVYLCFNINFL